MSKNTTLLTGLLATLAWIVPGCGDDGGGGGADTETGSGSGSSGATNAMTTASTNGMTTTTTGMTAGNDSSTSGMPPGDTTAAPSDSTGPAGSSSGGALDCEACGLAECGDEIAACLAVEECACWLDCVNAGGSGMMCGQMCMSQPPPELMPVRECITMNCAEECSDGGTTGTTGGGNADGAYDMCDPLGGGAECQDPLVCNMFLGYCTIEGCQDDTDCPDPGSGDATPTCSNFGNCVLPCDNGENCPTGMTCQQGGFQICGY